MKVKHILFFLLFSFILINPIKAMTPNVEYIDGVYSNRVASNNETFYGQLGFIVVDGKVVFCLEPYALIGDNYNINNDYLNSLSQDKLDYIELVSNYVNDKIQNRDVNYYMAAQELIWEKIIGSDKVYYTTQNQTKGTVINIDSYKNEIENYVNSFYIKPSFDGTFVSDNFYKTITLTDTNNVLSQYEIVNDSKNQVFKSNNSLIIRILSSELSTIKLVKKVSSGSPTYYHSSNGQDIADMTSEKEVVSTIQIQANNLYNENVTFQFLDNQTFEKLDNYEFKITNLDTSEEIIARTQDGHYTINLKAGKYEFSAVKATYGYLSFGRYIVEITENDLMEYRTFNLLVGKPICRINVEIEDTGLGQLYNSNNQLLSSIDSSHTYDVEYGDYYFLDLTNNKKYDISLNYIDQDTPIIEENILIKTIQNNIPSSDENNNSESSIEDKSNTNDNNTNIEEINQSSNDNESDRNITDEYNIGNTDLDIGVNDDIESVKESEIELPNILASVGSEEENYFTKILPNTSNYLRILFIVLVIVVIIFDLLYDKDNQNKS